MNRHAITCVDRVSRCYTLVILGILAQSLQVYVVLWDNVFHVIDMYSMAMVECIFYSVLSMIFASAGYQFYSNFCSLFFLVFEVIN
jgi:hypothetical protein